jgi:protein phosphatase
MSAQLLDFLFSGFEAVLSCPDPDIFCIGSSVSLPQFTASDLTSLCQLAHESFAAGPMVVRVQHEVCIVGDIHGTFHDLIRIFRDQGIASHYLFLGDYVDRGAFSLEVIVLLFILMLRFPTHFILLRGNHEVHKVCSEYGFLDEILSSGYPESVFDAFCEAFAWMPMAAIVQDSYFCVHGGIGPMISTIDEIEAIPRPVHVDSDVAVVRMMLWADPIDMPVSSGGSGRGGILSYGPLAVKPFLEANSLRGIIRAHQCVNGVHPMRSMPVFTVFSSSTYQTDPPNDAGILLVGNDGRLTPRIFPAIPRMERANCMFFSYARSEATLRIPMSQTCPLGEPRLKLPALVTPRKTNVLIAAITKPLIARTGSVKPILPGQVRASTSMMSISRDRLRRVSFGEDLEF